MSQDYQVTEQVSDNYRALADIENNYNTTGWIFLKIYTRTDYYSAGYLEGYLTYKEIYYAYLNFIESLNEGQHYLPLKAQEHITQQYKWMKQQPATDNYWKQVHNLLSQLEGMYDGYIKQTHQTEMELSFWQFYFLTNMGDLEDIIPSVAAKRGFGNCNTFMKGEFIGHNTFNIYSLMLRVYKIYDFYDLDLVNKMISFSSRPGDLESKDDFVLLHDTLQVVTETSLNNYDKANYAFLHPESLPTWVRVNVASRLAENPKQWGELFETSRSGTHNNQWLVSNFETIIMVEEAFYLYKVLDVTDMFKQQGFIASYNVPFNEEIYTQNNYQQYGFTYQNDPRAIQFNQYKNEAVDLLSTGKLIRANRVTAEFDICGAAISPRCDLTGFVFGGIDAKVISKDSLTKGEVLLISSPTYDGISPFNWKDHPKVPHHGMVDEWKFGWVTLNINDFVITHLE